MSLQRWSEYDKTPEFASELTASDVVHVDVNQDHDWVPNSRALLKVLVATSTAVYTDGMPEMGDGTNTTKMHVMIKLRVIQSSRCQGFYRV